MSAPPSRDLREQILLEAIHLFGELKSIDTGVATWTLLGMMYPYFYPAHSHDMPSTSDVAEQLLEIYLDGVIGQQE
jgi:hypothetical protein